MSVITTKFSVGDLVYTFDNKAGIIYRSIVHEINVTSKNTDLEVTYFLNNTTPDPKSSVTSPARVTTNAEYEQNLHTELEIKDIANTWLINKSLSIFQNAGL